MAGENVASPSAHQQTAASATPSQPIPAASPTAANINTQQVSTGAPPPAQLAAVNLAQPQNYAPNQQTLNQISFSQQQPKAGVAGATRSLHNQYVQNVQNPSQQQQPPSPAMGVQSPPQSGAASMPRSSSGSRIVQVSPNTAGLRAGTTAPTGLGGQFVGSASLQQQQQQQQMLASQRVSQGQAAQQRPAQSGQTSHLQSGQLPSAGLITGSSTMRSVYSSSPYMQVRPTMGGQMQMPMSPQYTAALHQQMHGRQKAGPVSASQFPAAATPSSQLHLGGGVGSMSGVGSQLTRPSGSVVQQSQPINRMQPMQSRQPQTQQQSQQSQQLSQQQVSPQIQKVPSMSSLGTGVVSSSQPPSGANNLQNQAQQGWMQKPLNQVSAAQPSYQVSPQQAALHKQGQAQYSHHLQGQPQQAQPSLMNQQLQMGRLQSSVNQRSAGVQPGTLGTGAPTTIMGANTQSLDAGNRILGKRSIQELVAQVDPNRRLDPEVEDMLLEIADDFIESVTTFACKLAKHRKSNILEAKDVLLHLNRNWDLSIPGFNGEEYHAYKKASINETHKQRLALIKKSMATQQAGQEPVAARASVGGQPVTTSTPGSQAPATA